MMDHVSRLERIFTDAGIKFTRVKSEHSFEWYMFDYAPNRKNPALQSVKGQSWPGPKARWCTAELKTRVIAKYLKELNTRFTVIQLIGLAADEKNRLEREGNKNPNYRHPLADWGWTEADCLKYCYDRGFDWGGLYEIFHRVSCWCCPLQSLEELRQLRKHFPDLWLKLLDMESRTWRKFRADYSVDQLEIRFQLEEERAAQGLSISGHSKEFQAALKFKLEQILKYAE